MKHFFGKKQALLATLAVALGAAVYLNYYFAQQTPGVAEEPSATSPTAVSEPTGHLGDSQYVSGATAEPPQEASVTTAAGYFADARANREAARAEALETLQELANNVKSSEETVKQATQDMLAAAQAIDRESKIENLIRSKGFSDCVVYIEGEKCHVVVQSDGLSAAQTLQITEIVTDQSEVLQENIKISAVKS